MEKRIYGLATLRTTSKEMLRVVYKFTRGMRESVPKDNLAAFDEAIRKITEGCETILRMKFRDEDDTTNK